MNLQFSRRLFHGSALAVVVLGVAVAAEAASKRVERAIERSKAAWTRWSSRRIRMLRRSPKTRRTRRVRSMTSSFRLQNFGAWRIASGGTRQRRHATWGRFEACADGLTVADPATGLLWEMKTTSSGLHYVDNRYSWSARHNFSDPSEEGGSPPTPGTARSSANS